MYYYAMLWGITSCKVPRCMVSYTVLFCTALYCAHILIGTVQLHSHEHGCIHAVTWDCLFPGHTWRYINRHTAMSCHTSRLYSHAQACNVLNCIIVILIHASLWCAILCSAIICYALYYASPYINNDLYYWCTVVLSVVLWCDPLCCTYCSRPYCLHSTMLCTLYSNA